MDKIPSYVLFSYDSPSLEWDKTVSVERLDNGTYQYRAKLTSFDMPDVCANGTECSEIISEEMARDIFETLKSDKSYTIININIEE